MLLAYARRNKAVGYCQGFNVIAALILQVMERNEEDALKVTPDHHFVAAHRPFRKNPLKWNSLKTKQFLMVFILEAETATRTRTLFKNIISCYYSYFVVTPSRLEWKMCIIIAGIKLA